MKATIIKNNFSAGELSPLLTTRTDIQQYSNGAKEIKNLIPLVEGGVKRRPGTFFRSIFLGAIRLIPFVVNSESAYLLIFKANEIIVYDPRSYFVVMELDSPYSASQINDIQYVQYRYSMFMTHSEVPVQRFRCSEDFTNWEMAAFTYAHAPLDDENARYPFRKAKPSGVDNGGYIIVSMSLIAGWEETTEYIIGDVVTYSGAFYQAIQLTLGNIPTDTEYWIEVPETSADIFTSADIGSYLSINGGLVKITKFINSNQVGGEVVKKLESDVLAIERSWSVTPPAFNQANGYPRCCTFFKQRLVLANTKVSPNKIWFSAVAGNSNFLETTEDADAFSVVSASGLSNSILFLEATRGVVCLTSGGEYMVSADGALTPTSVEINEHTSYGAYPITRPCRVGNELLFVQRGGERLRALSYRYEVDGLVSPEISVLSSHIGEEHSGIDEIVYQQEPESIVWCKMGDGKVSSITFNRDQEVIAWAQHDFGGDVLSMCTLPTRLGSDQCFMLINRNNFTCLEEVSANAQLDSQGNIEISENRIHIGIVNYLREYSLLRELDNYSYSINFTEEGYYLNIQDSEETGTVIVGKPFKAKLSMFPPELAQSPASSMLSKAKIQKVAFFFHKTYAPIFNGERLELFGFAHTPMDGQKPFTGRHLYEGGDFQELFDTEMVITTDQPLPFHMQALAIEITINER